MDKIVAGHRLRILIVEDSHDAADTLAILLQLWGHEVRVAYNGLAGLRAARESAPDCLISDISMPGMDGYELARQVRGDESLGATKLIAVSAFSDADHVRKVLDAGFDFRLTKPAALEDIQEALKMIEQIKDLAAETKELARQNVVLASQTKGLLEEVREDLKEVKDEVKELKEEVKELKQGRGDEYLTTG